MIGGQQYRYKTAYAPKPQRREKPEVVDYTKGGDRWPRKASQETRPPVDMRGQHDYQSAAQTRAADLPKPDTASLDDEAWQILAEQGEEALVEHLAKQAVVQYGPHEFPVTFDAPWRDPSYRDPREAEESPNLFYASSRRARR